MPPRHAYWTILIDNQATAFRAHDAEELLPTLNRLREKNASAVLKWFERGQLFDSRDAAREQGFGRGERRWEGARPDREESRGHGERPPRYDERPPRKRPLPAGVERSSAAEQPSDADTGRPRNRDWRPGGEHRDPRQKFRDAKKAKWQRFKKQVRERHERRDEVKQSFENRPDRWQPKGPPRERSDRDTGFSGQAGKPPFDPNRASRKPWGSKPGGARGEKPWGAKPGGSARKPWGAKPGASARKPWGGKPGASARKPWGTKPGGPARKPWGSKPGGPARKPWGTTPGGAARKPWGAKPGEPKPWAADRERRPEPRGDRRPSNGPRGPRRDWRADRPPKRRKDEDE